MTSNLRSLIGAFVDEALSIFEMYECKIEELKEGQNQIQSVILEIREALESRQPMKEAYTVAEVAELLGKRPYTVRQWCRLGRVNAKKRPVGRGDTREWEISAEEVERIKNHGLLPFINHYYERG